MEFLDNLRQYLSQHVSGRFAQLIFDPMFLVGAAGLAVLLIVLIILAAS